MLGLGVTRVELGVQTDYDDVYKFVNRGHTVDDVAKSTRMLKDAGFSVIYHMMPGLMGSDFNQDLEAFKTIFEDERFKPDAIKIYPTLVMPNTKLYDLWKNNQYTPYSLQETVKLITEIKKQVPKWVRIQRIQRDIPINLIAEGVKRGDLRILVQKQLKKDGGKCNCIRCREVGHVQYKSSYDSAPENVKLVIEKYAASKGEEIFLSFEDTKSDVLIGLLRLRHPSKTGSMLVRELHVFGPTVRVGENAEENQWQHKGWGERLMQEAERISQEEYDAHKISILSGIGTRNYYRRFGYERDGPYMVKKF